MIGLVFLWLRPRRDARLWPLLLPLIVATQFAVPGTLGSLEQAFFPQGGLVAEQEGMAGDCSSSGRVADLGPTLDEVGKKPFLGYGYGTRVDDGDEPERLHPRQPVAGYAARGRRPRLRSRGCCCSSHARRSARAKDDDSATGWLLVGVTASVTAYAVGILTFDALGFSQVTFVLFLILGLGAAARATARRDGGPAPPTEPISPRRDPGAGGLQRAASARRLPRRAACRRG